MQPTAPVESHSHHLRTYLKLTRLLDEIERDHPEVSAPLRLTLLRARRDGQLGSLDQDSFRAAAARYDGRVGGQPRLVPAVL